MRLDKGFGNSCKYNLFHIPLVIGNTHQTWKYLHSFCAMSQPVTQNLWYNLWLPQVDLNKRSGREFISKAKANKMFMPNINYYDILRRCNRLFEIFGHCPAKLKVHFQTHPLIFINVLAYNTQFWKHWEQYFHGRTCIKGLFMPS